MLTEPQQLGYSFKQGVNLSLATKFLRGQPVRKSSSKTKKITMQEPSNAQQKGANASVKLNRIVTPSHIKIQAVPRDQETPVAPAQDVDPIGVMETGANPQGMSPLKKLAVACVVLIAIIGVLMVPWPSSTIETGAPEATPNVASATPEQFFIPTPEQTLPVEEIVPLKAPTQIESILRAPSPSVSPTVSPVPRPVPIPRVTTFNAPVVNDPVTSKSPDPEIVAIAPSPSAPVEQDFIQQVTSGTVAALRGLNAGGDVQPVLDFARAALRGGSTIAAVDRDLNAAFAAGTLNVPPRLLDAQGHVNTAAVLATLERSQ